MIGVLTALNVALPQLIALYRMIRDSTKQRDPQTPALSDADLIAIMGVAADKVVAHADSILAKHRAPDLPPSA